MEGSFYEYLTAANDEALGFLKGSLEETMPGRIRSRKSLIDKVDKDDAMSIIERCVGLIKTIPKKEHLRIAKYFRDVFSGRRTVKDIVPYLVRIGDVTEERAELIANDQINKIAQLLQVEKWKKDGIAFVKWVHGDCEDPRKYHKTKWNGRSGGRSGKPNGLDGFVFPLSQPPVIDTATGERGFPGQLINCGCHLEPIRL